MPPHGRSAHRAQAYGSGVIGSIIRYMIKRSVTNLQKLLASVVRLPRSRRHLVLGVVVFVIVIVLSTSQRQPQSSTKPSATISAGSIALSPSPSTAPDPSANTAQSDQPADQLVDTDPTAPRLDEGALYNVASVVDGDTIKVNIDGRVETIRFIGMDTPEVKDPRKPVQCFGREASARMQALVAGKAVRLEADPSQGERDKYNRLLRYVYSADGTNLAYQMIRQGYAHEYTYYTPYRYQTQFRSAQSFAQSNNLGLWSASTCNGKP